MNEILKDAKPMTVYCSDGSFEIIPKTVIGKAFVEMNNASYRQGMKPCTEEEFLKAWEEERAGNDGLAKLWSR
ncbi:MAG: hypothetical protein LBR23_07360 [Spirochaetaceae bacterium]|jgi:hypothetical protein|nr:hypothetical protein [Spirochaetaceae bacterium]